QLETAIVHEVGHNWFQGILATNERNEPWLDEGINSFYEMEYFLQKYPNQNVTDFDAIGTPIANLLGNKFLNAHSYKFNQYQSAARTWSNQPNNLQANSYTQSNYGNIIYAKSAVAIAYLKKYLGNNLFKQCMQQYFLRWQFMHPNTYEFKNVIEDVSQQNVDWFFDEIIATNNLVDYKIKKVSQRPPYTISIKNKTGIAAPVFIDVNYANGTEQICLNGFQKSALIPLQEKPVSIVIDSLNMMMDSYFANNYYNSKQLFKKQTLGLRFYSSYDAKKSLLYYIPLAGWNQYNHWMPGVLIHNQSLVPKPLEFAIMPLYSFATNNLNGSFMFQYKQALSLQWQYIAKIKGMQYNFGSTYFNATDQLQQFRFKKIQPSIIIQHRSDVLSKLLQQISATAYFINRNDVFENGTVPSVKSENFYYQQLDYEIKNNRTFDPWQALLTIENGKNYLKAFTQAQYNFSYKRRQRGITVNAFAGTFIYNENEMQNVNFRMSGFSGMQDYLFNYTYLGRSESEGILSKQFIANDGGFKINTAVGQTNKWLTSLNLQVTIP
ncbi:MAG TPA: M1 family aminopeptidase, partial [Bacteroidia bacterium]|nr:M1 family aminopeptidase [Bacteroidia bacterium]